MMVMRVNTETNSFTRVTQLKWLRDKIALSNAVPRLHILLAYPIAHGKDFRHPSILIASPRITKTLFLVKTSKTGPRHMTRSIVDSWNEKHSKSFTLRKVIKYMIL